MFVKSTAPIYTRREVLTYQQNIALNVIYHPTYVLCSASTSNKFKSSNALMESLNHHVMEDILWFNHTFISIMKPERSISDVLICVYLFLSLITQNRL